MAWTYKCGGRLALRRHERFLECDALVSLKHGLSDADEPISIAYRGRDAGDLVATWLALPDGPGKTLEGLQEERLDIVRLQSPSFSSLHVLTNPMNTACVHGITGESVLFQQVLKLGPIKYMRDCLVLHGPRAVHRSESLR